MNVNQCRASLPSSPQPSSPAETSPGLGGTGNSGTDFAEQQIRALLRVELLRTRPHVLCLQECPTVDWAASIFGGCDDSSGAGRGAENRGIGSGDWHWCHGSGKYQAGYVSVGPP
jgi:hypothetical protein